MRLLMLFLAFLLLGGFFIVSNQNLHLINKEDVSVFYDSYLSWCGGILSNIKSVTGYVVNLKWIPSSS